MAATGDYYINLVTGEIQQQTDPVLAAALLAADYKGPFASIAAAKAAYPEDVSGEAASAAEKAAGFTLGGLGLHWPSADAFLGRALKIVIGGVLLIAGILKMTGASKAALGVAGQVASKVPGV
jgi:hypothetical protein